MRTENLQQFFVRHIFKLEQEDTISRHQLATHRVCRHQEALDS